MGTVSVSLPPDGIVLDAAKYNTPITTIATELNGNLDNANIKSSAAIDGSKISGGSSTMFSAWASWTPTWTNLTVGSGTVDAKYIQIGKSVQFRLIFTYGAGSAVGTNPVFTLPVTSVATPNALFPLGTCFMDNNGGSGFNGIFVWTSTTTAGLRYWDTNNNSNSVTATAPVTWASSYKFYGLGTYEAA